MWLLLAGSAAGASGAAWVLDARQRRRAAAARSGRGGAGGGAGASRTGEGGERGASDDDQAGPSGREDEAARPGLRLAAAALAAGGLLVLACGAVLAIHRRARSRRGDKRQASGGPVRIPLRELVRFREEQWFMEELENSREGDPNAMLRLAKMYLYGQGCERNTNIAQEWLRRARAGGVYCTLDELVTAEDLEAYRRQARASSSERLRQLQQQQGRPAARGAA